MRNALRVFLLLSLVFIVQSRPRRKNPVDLCTIPVVLRVPRSICDPLMKLWVLRGGLCVEARQCIRGYSKGECEKHCLGRIQTNQKGGTEECTTKRTLTTKPGITTSSTSQRTIAKRIETPSRTKITRRPRTTPHVDCLFMNPTKGK